MGHAMNNNYNMLTLSHVVQFFQISQAKTLEWFSSINYQDLVSVIKIEVCNIEFSTQNVGVAFIFDK